MTSLTFHLGSDPRMPMPKMAQVMARMKSHPESPATATRKPILAPMLVASSR